MPKRARRGRRKVSEVCQVRHKKKVKNFHKSLAYFTQVCDNNHVSRKERQADQEIKMKIELKLWQKNSIKRIYANDELGNSVGYFESRFESTPRGTSSYDQHRVAKGDNQTSGWTEFTFVGDKAIGEAIYAQVVIDANNLPNWYLEAACTNSLPFGLAMKAKSKWTAADKKLAAEITSRRIEVAA